MSHPIPVERAPRFTQFDDHERAVLGYALALLADSTLADAEREDIDRESLPSAGASFLLACKMAYEICDLDGEEHPPLEVTELLAACIAEGDAPMAAKMAAEADSDGRPVEGDQSPLGPLA